VLDILVAEGDTVKVGTPLVVIGEAGESTGPQAAGEIAEPPAQSAPAAPAPAVAAPAPAVAALEASPPGPPEPPEMHPASETTVDDVEAFFAEPDETEKKPNLLSPVVRKLIRENDIDVSHLAGSGEGGRITRKDVEAFIESGQGESAPVESPKVEEEPAVPAQPVASAEPSEEAVATAPSAAPAAVTQGEAADEVPLDRIRVRIAENMIKARQTAAHVWTSVEVDFERVERVRQSHKAAFKEDEGFSLTYLPFISRATIDALKAFPIVNSSLDLEEKKSILHKKVDLGIAIDLNQGGLVVARVREADGLRLVGLAREIRDLAERGRDGKLGLDDLTGSTFTITNPGPFGSFMSAPIINVPNVGILSTDTVSKRPTVVTATDGQDMIAIRHIGYLGLSWDHRAFDGSTAVMFLQRIKQNLETWDWEQELA
jgi:pyruvate dehydrogenase E2 component (dihydrolipoyllysine-residue acetyltransferase)